MKYWLITILFLVSGYVCFAQTTSETPETIIDNFFKVYKKEGARAAVDMIYTYGDSSMQQSREYVRDTFAHTAAPMGGTILGNEQINRVAVAPSLVGYTYLVKYTYAPMRITFLFYKPNDKWMVQHFSFDTNVFSELYKATRLEPQK